MRQNAPSGSLLLGNLAELKQDFLGTLQRWQQEYGDIVPFRLGPQRFYLISHPSPAEEILIKQAKNFSKTYNPERPRGLALVLGKGLVTSQGELWQRQRRMMQPAFARSQIANLTPVIQLAIDDLLNEWQQKDLSQPIELCSDMMRLTLEIITRTMFSVSIKDKARELAPSLDECLAFAQYNFFSALPTPLWIPTARNRRFKHAKQLLDHTVRQIIQQRQGGSTQHTDLLQILLNARDPETGEQMSEQQLLDELLTIFGAGHETTANALSWTWYLLSQHPEAQAKLQQELHTQLSGRPVQFDDLAQLPYTRAVFEESMRLYPPAVSLLRLATQDTPVGTHTIPKGSKILVNIRNIQRHPDLWDEPQHFNPERFMPDQRPNIKRYAYIPFGLGARACIGNHLAMTEAMLVIANIAQQYQLKLLKDHPVEEQLNVTLRPKFGLKILLTRRAEIPHTL